MIESAAEFARLRESENADDIRRSIDEAATTETWFRVIRDYPHLRRWVAHNRTVPRNVLQQLLPSDDPQVRWTLATKRRTDAAMLDELSRDSDDGVRLRVAQHKNATTQTLVRLLDDPWDVVRQAAAESLSRTRN